MDSNDTMPSDDFGLVDTANPVPPDRRLDPPSEDDGLQLAAPDAEALRERSLRDAADLDIRQRKARLANKLFGGTQRAVKIDRFTILRKLGEGGMGLVYLVYDAKLDRRLAVKLLRGTGHSPELQTRFEREAQAMARLSHPNVVAVYEAGTHEGQLFVAMEYVAGQDLRGWMSAEHRGWREVIEHFQQAGEGLMAAHAAGIVHRDFKPDNALVGEDGRVRVADFGLAHGLGGGFELPSGELEDSQGNHLVLQLTRTGAVMGTPAYMPPEQYAGRRSDARGDQFSFCVALWEALYGQRPFLGRSMGQLARAINTGSIDEPQDERGVPSWVRAVVVRGLAPNPEQRWPSMRALLDALADDPQIRRRRLLVRVTAGLGALALVAASTVAAREFEHNQRQRYWNELTEELLDVERERGLEQALDDARRAKDATRMGMMRSYKPGAGQLRREDATIAAALLREVGPEQTAGSEWLSAANQILGAPLTKWVMSGHQAPLGPLQFSPDSQWIYSGADDGEVWRWRVASGEGERLYAHGSVVTELVVSADGEWVASSSEDGSVRLWSPGAGGEGREVMRFEQAATDVDIDPQGRWLAACSRDGRVRLSELEGQQEIELHIESKRVNALEFDPSGEWLVTGSHDTIARLWRVGETEPRARFEGHDKPIFMVRALSSTRVITAADDGTSRLWELDADGAVHTRVLTQHAQPVSALDVRGERIVTGAIDGSIRVASLEALDASWSLPGHGSQVWSVSFSPDGAFVASASFDNSAHLTAVDGHTAPRVFLGHKESLFRAAIDPKGRWLATGSYDMDVRLWDLSTPWLETLLPGHEGPVFSAESDPTGQWAITASQDGRARVWSMTTGELRATLDARSGAWLNDDNLHHAVLSAGAGRAAAATNIGEVFVWELSAEGASEPRLLGRHERAVWRLAFSPAGERLASASYDHTLRIWQLDEDAPPLILRGHGDRVLDLAFDGGGTRLLSASYDGSVRVWDTHSGEQLAIHEAHQGKILCLRASPDGQRWASGSEDKTVSLWPTGLDAPARVLRGHEGLVWSLVFSPDGEQLASVDRLGEARVWEVDSGRLLHRFDDHPGGLWDVEFLAGQRLATASIDGALRLWSLTGDAPPLVFSGHGDAIQALAVGMGGHRVMTSSVDGTGKLWSLDVPSADPEQLRARLWAATGVCLTPEQRQRELGETRQAAQRANEACARTVLARDSRRELESTRREIQ